jgi:hypothetical protein
LASTRNSPRGGQERRRKVSVDQFSRNKYIPINNPQDEDENIFSFSAMKNNQPVLGQLSIKVYFAAVIYEEVLD